VKITVPSESITFCSVRFGQLSVGISWTMYLSSNGPTDVRLPFGTHPQYAKLFAMAAHPGYVCSGLAA
jgi:hypothetical protein